MFRRTCANRAPRERMKRMEQEFLRPLLKTNANIHMMVETAAGTKNDAMTITVAKQKADVVKIIRLFTRRPSGESRLKLRVRLSHLF